MARDSGPYFAFCSLSLAAISSSASSQVIGSNRPSPLRADSAQRVLQSLRRIDPLGSGVGFGAEPAPVQRRLFHPLDADEFPISHGGVNSAATAGPHMAQKVGTACSCRAALPLELLIVHL